MVTRCYLKYISFERVSMDETCTFKCHINTLASKLRQKYGYLYRSRATFPNFCRKQVIEAVSLFVLDLGDVIYGHASVSNLTPLDCYCNHPCILY